MAETVNTNQFRNGMHIAVDGDVWRIVEFQHVKPGKGGAFVRTKLKGLDTGAVVDKTFRAGERFARVHTEVKTVQYLYDDGSEAHFMDQETYDQFGLPHAEVADALPFLAPSSSVQMLAVDGKPAGLQMPASVELTVA
jgi:elongation factor P